MEVVCFILFYYFFWSFELQLNLILWFAIHRSQDLCTRNEIIAYCYAMQCFQKKTSQLYKWKFGIIEQSYYGSQRCTYVSPSTSRLPSRSHCDHTRYLYSWLKSTFGQRKLAVTCSNDLKCISPASQKIINLTRDQLLCIYSACWDLSDALHLQQNSFSYTDFCTSTETV